MFEQLCDKEKIKQEKTTADSPQLNAVAERAIGIIESAGLAAKIQALEMYPNQDIPSGYSLWAEQANWACHVLNCTAISANPGKKTQHETWHGSPPENNLLPFLKTGFCKVRRTDKLQRKAQICWYLGPAPGPVSYTHLTLPTILLV